MWLGPPYMNKKMTLLAFAGRPGGFAASGLAKVDAADARDVKNPSVERSDVSAAAPNPQPVSQRNSRRVRPQKLFCFFDIAGLSLGKQIRSGSALPGTNSAVLLRQTCRDYSLAVRR